MRVSEEHLTTALLKWLDHLPWKASVEKQNAGCQVMFFWRRYRREHSLPNDLSIWTGILEEF